VSGPHVVLVVDADPVARKAVAAALSAERYRLVYAASAEAAREVLASEPVTVLVAEPVLPGPGGLSVLAEARRSHPHVARIVLAESVDLGAAMHAINEAEVLRFLHKPVEAARLRKAVDEAVAWTAGARDAADARAAAERRNAATSALADAHPGLLPAVAGPDGYAIPPHRFRSLVARLASTPLGPALAAAAKRGA
jgi:two-component system probable response regulator PhcQ